MGTRGAFGFRLNGEDKITYNHFDSYPDGLGNSVVDFARTAVQDLPGLKAKVSALRLVDSNTPPTDADIEACQKAGTVDLGVSNQSTSDWYCLLRHAQGELEKYLEVGLMVDNQDFMADSLFCEYAYVINLDDETLEFYRGFNKDGDQPGRYAKLMRDSSSAALQRMEMDRVYFGVVLALTIPLAELNSRSTEAIVDQMNSVLEE